MAVFSLLPVYRLLGIGLLIYLQYLSEVCAGDQHNRNGSLDGHLQQSNDGGNTHSESSRKMGRIEASIIPIVNSERHAEEKESSRTFSKAEVRVVVPKESGTLRNSLIRPPDPHEEGLIRASSILMEYEEDTRKYIHPGARTHSHEHRIRHSLHKHIAPEPLLDDYFSANDAPLNEIDSSSPTDDPQTKTNDEDLSSSDSKVDPTRILVHVNSFSSAPRRRYPSSKSLGKNVHANTIPKAIASTRTFKPLGQDSVIAFHSPVRIYIPVRYDATSNPPELNTDTSCVRCPQNITLMAFRGETQAETPVPAISICHRPGKVESAGSIYFLMHF